MRATSLASLLLPALAAAQWPWYLRYNADDPGPSYSLSAYTAAEMNETREISFPGSLSSEWTWTLSISDMPIPPGLENLNYSYSKNESLPAADARVAYTRYSFNSPQVEAAAAEQASGGWCYTPFDTIFPQNVSNAWNSSSSACTGAIGAACEEYILSTLRPRNAEGQCQTPTCNILTNAACAGQLGFYLGTGAHNFSDTSDFTNDTALADGETFAWTLSDVYAPGNTTVFEAEKNRLHMFALSSPPGSQLLCNRIGSGVGSNGTRDACAEDSNTAEKTTESMGAGQGLGLSVAVMCMATMLSLIL